MGEVDLQSHDLVKKYPPKYWRVWVDIFLAYLFSISIITINLILAQKEIAFLFKMIVLLASSLVLSILLHFLFLFLHEAGHWGLLRNKFWNDFLGNLLIGFWFIWDVKLYRKTHWGHHLKHGKADDPENSYFLPLSFKNLVFAFIGFFAIKKVFDKNNGKIDIMEDETYSLQRVRAAFFFLVYQLLMVALFFSFDAHIEYFLIWCIPFFFGFPFLGFVRQVCEHRENGVGSKNLHGQAHDAHTRVFKCTLGSYFLGGGGFRLHWFHHDNPYISYTRLEDFALALKSKKPEDIEDIQEVTYLNTFKLLFSEVKVTHSP